MSNVIGAVFGAIILIVVFVTLLPTIADNTVGLNQTTSNVTGATWTLNSLIPLLLVVGVIAAILAAIGLKTFS